MPPKNISLNFIDLRISRKLRPAITWSKLRKERHNIPQSHRKMFGSPSTKERGIHDNFFESHFDPSQIKFITVWDLDETLILADFEKVVTGNFLYFIRPYAKICLKTCSNEKRCINVLWSMGDDIHVYDAIKKCDIEEYFDLILTRKDCTKSFEEFGANKSYQYLQKLLRLSNFSKSVLIDDKAVTNAGTNQLANYTDLITVKPFEPKHVINILKEKSMDMQLYKILKYLEKLFA